jgi:hypothetical protein
MKFLLALMLAFSASAMTCDMYFESEDLCANFEWTKGPVLNEYSAFEVSFFNEGDTTQTVSPRKDVYMFTWMMMANGHNHGGPAIHSNELIPGVFTVEDAKFFMHGMKGYWMVKVQIRDGETVLDEQAIKVEF